MLLMLISKTAFAQGMPVYDNTNFIALGKSLIESAKQTSQLLKTVSYLQEQKERLEQVSSVIRQVRAVQEIVENNQELMSRIDTDLREILSSPYIRPHEVELIAGSFEAAVSLAMEDMQLMQQLLTSNLLSMSDAERLALLEVQKQRSRALLTELELRTRRYRSIISFRQFSQQVNSRETAY